MGSKMKDASTYKLECIYILNERIKRAESCRDFFEKLGNTDTAQKWFTVALVLKETKKEIISNNIFY